MGDADLHRSKILSQLLHGGIIASSRLAEIFFPGGGNSKLATQVCELQFKSLNPSRERR